MPPPVGPQSSRTGLITAVVIFTILFVTATIFAIYYGVDATRTHEELAVTKRSYIPDLVQDGSLTSPQIDQLKELRQGENAAKYGLRPDMPLLTVATTMRDNLAKMVDPAATGAGADKALDSGKFALSSAAKKAQGAGVTLAAGDNLVGAVNSLSDAVVAKQNQIKGLEQQLAAAKAETQQKVDQLSAASAEMAKQMEAVRADAGKAVADAAADREAKQGQVGAIETDRTKEREALQENVNKMTNDIKAKTADVERLQRELATVRERLSGQRISSNEPIMRAADGTIIRVPGNNIVYISRGSGDQIVPGMTFEVYDKSTGIPRAGDPTTNENLPEGKASIEVIRVGPTSSEARITRTKPGQTSLQEGDLIANLVYDPNVKYKFVVYGKFDLDNNNVATAQDTEVVKRLITQWGGLMQDKINVDTDFVIMGKEPTIPTLSDEDRQNPLELQRLANAEAELNAYQETLSHARDLHIPILNQNRFLYFIGYYDAVKR